LPLPAAPPVPAAPVPLDPLVVPPLPLLGATGPPPVWFVSPLPAVVFDATGGRESFAALGLLCGSGAALVEPPAPNAGTVEP
jgi:hypothetical protein